MNQFPPLLYQGQTMRTTETVDDLVPNVALCVCGNQFQIKSHPRFPKKEYRSRVIGEIKQFFMDKAAEVIVDRVNKAADLIQKHPKKIVIKLYKARWGCCTHEGNLRMNWALIMAPLTVIDYVAIHELCHLIHMDHSCRFWQEVQRYAPQYKDARRWLKTHGLQIIRAAFWIDAESHIS